MKEARRLAPEYSVVRGALARCWRRLAVVWCWLRLAMVWFGGVGLRWSGEGDGFGSVGQRRRYKKGGQGFGLVWWGRRLCVGATTLDRWGSGAD
jgi:hypothetical protein